MKNLGSPWLLLLEPLPSLIRVSEEENMREREKELKDKKKRKDRSKMDFGCVLRQSEKKVKTAIYKKKN